MIYGVGIDIVEVYKIKKIVTYSGDKLAKRIFSTSEWEIYQKRKNRSIHFLATRFAAKEAVSKAFGTGMCKGITFTQLEIFNDKLGKPILHLLSSAALLAKKLALKEAHITLSNTNTYACAMVIFEQ